MADAFEELGNPYLEDSGNLLNIDQSIIMPWDVVYNFQILYSTGETIPRCY